MSRYFLSCSTTKKPACRRSVVRCQKRAQWDEKNQFLCSLPSQMIIYRHGSCRHDIASRCCLISSTSRFLPPFHVPLHETVLYCSKLAQRTRACGHTNQCAFSHRKNRTQFKLLFEGYTALDEPNSICAVLYCTSNENEKKARNTIA